MDLTKLTEAQLDRLEAVGGDLSQLNDDELDALEASQMTLTDKAKALGGKALDYGIRGLDYAGGLTRTAVANVADEVAQLMGIYDEDRISAPETLRAAYRGEAPGTAELMEMAQIPEGSSVNLFPEITIPGTDITLGKGDTSIRDAVGFAGDIALDPLTYLTAGGAHAVKGVANAARPLARAQAATGRKIYQSGLKKGDFVAKKFGKGDKALSDMLLKRGIRGSSESIAEQGVTLADSLFRRQQGILAEATARGAQLDPAQVMGPVQKKINKILSARNPVPKKAAGEYAKMIDDIASTAAHGNQASLFNRMMTPVEASDIKTSLYNLVGDSAYDTLKKSKDGSKLLKMTARQLKNSVEGSVDKVSKKLGSEFRQVQKDLGTILTSRKVLSSEAGKEIGKNAFTSIDGIILANPTVFAAKKTADLLKTTGARTRTGANLYHDIGLSDAFLRRTNTIRDRE